MERNEELAKKYQAITESKKAKPIRENEKALFETLLDNQMKHLNEQTYSGDMARLGQVLVPVFRRAFPQLIAKDIVGVQPLSQPVGYAFALRYHYAGNSTANTTAGVTPLGGKSGYSTTNSADNQRTTANSILLVYNSTANRQAEIADRAANATTTYPAITTVNGISTTGVGGNCVYTEDNKALLVN